MKAELTDISAVQKRIDIEVPSEVVAEQVTTIAREFAKRARIPGFRPGKAPLGVVKNRYREDILSEMYQHLLPRYFYEAVQEKDLSVVEASTVFEQPQYASGEPLNFQVGFEVFPNFTVEDYAEIPVEEVPTEVTDKEIDEYFENLLEERAEMTPVEGDREIQTGDFAEITFSGSLVGATEDAEGEDLSGEKALCEIGGESTVREFTENLTGARSGDERSFDVVYREDHPEKRLAGKTAHYTVKVEGVKQKKRPELDDELAQSLGDFATIDALRVEVRKNMEAHRKEHAQQQQRDGILRWLEDNNEFDVPDSLVEGQLRARLERLMRNLTQQGMNPQQLDIDWGRIRSDQYAQAVRDVRGMLILDHLADQENITVTDEDVDAELATMAEQMGQTPISVRQALEANNGLDRMKDQIRNNKILQLLEGRAKIVPAGSLTRPETPESNDDSSGEAAAGSTIIQPGDSAASQS
jgi:trigger factor